MYSDGHLVLILKNFYKLIKVKLNYKLHFRAPIGALVYLLRPLEHSFGARKKSVKQLLPGVRTDRHSNLKRPLQALYSCEVNSTLIRLTSILTILLRMSTLKYYSTSNNENYILFLIMCFFR